MRAAKERWREFQEDVKANPASSWQEALKHQGKYMRGHWMTYTEYEGHYPYLILAFELRNLGTKTAREVSVTVSYDSDFLEPIEFPRLAGKVARLVRTAPGYPLRLLIPVRRDASSAFDHPRHVHEVPGHESRVLVHEVVLGTSRAGV